MRRILVVIGLLALLVGCGPFLAATPTPTPIPTPRPLASPDVELLVWTEPARPSQGNRVTVFGRLSDKKAGVKGLEMTVKWQYSGRDPKTGKVGTYEEICVGTTDARGIASCTQTMRLPRARVEVIINYKGYPYKSVREF